MYCTYVYMYVCVCVRVCVLISCMRLSRATSVLAVMSRLLAGGDCIPVVGIGGQM